MTFDITGTGLAARAEMHRVAYCRALGHDPDTISFAPVIRQALDTTDGPFKRVEIVTTDNGTAEIIFTRAETDNGYRDAYVTLREAILVVTNGHDRGGRTVAEWLDDALNAANRQSG